MYDKQGNNNKEGEPQSTTSSRFPALLDRSGGCGTRTACSDSPRRLPLTCLRYSVVEQGYPKAKFKSGFEIEVRVWAVPTRIFVYVFGVRCAHTAYGFEVALLLTYLPLCAADKNHHHAVLLGEDCLSTWLRSRSCEFRSPAWWWFYREPRRGGKPGIAFFWLLILAKQEKWLAAGLPRQL